MEVLYYRFLRDLRDVFLDDYIKETGCLEGYPMDENVFDLLEVGPDGHHAGDHDDVDDDFSDDGFNEEIVEDSDYDEEEEEEYDVDNDDDSGDDYDGDGYDGDNEIDYDNDEDNVYPGFVNEEEDDVVNADMLNQVDYNFEVAAEMSDSDYENSSDSDDDRFSDIDEEYLDFFNDNADDADDAGVCDDEGYNDELYNYEEEDYDPNDCWKTRWMVDQVNKRFEDVSWSINKTMFQVWLRAPNKTWAAVQTLNLMKSLGKSRMEKIKDARDYCRELKEAMTIHL